MRNGKAGIALAESLGRFSRDLQHVAAFDKQAQFSRVKIIILAEGEIGDLQVGLKGTMGAIYLKDLCACCGRTVAVGKDYLGRHDA